MTKRGTISGDIISYTSLSVNDKKKLEEAIQLSGWTIQSQDTSGKQNIIIKKTLFFRASDPETEDHFEPVFDLLDPLLSKCTAKQCQVVYLKLMGWDEEAIAEKLNKYRPTINEHSTAAEWNAIHTAVKHFENRVQ